MDIDNHVMLKREAAYFFWCLFDSTASSDLIENYSKAHECLIDLRSLPADELLTVGVIIEKRLNAAFVEPWLRRKGGRHALSAKLLLILYLVECSGGTDGVFRRGTQNWLEILILVIAGFFGLMRGAYVKVRHGLV
jgi:hypothetical protein